MVKASDIGALVERYLSEKKLDCLEALYMWSKGIPPITIAPLLRTKYGSDVGYITINDDLSNLKITRNDENAEDTKEPINMIIENLFGLKCVNELLDQITEKYGAIPERAKYLLLALVRSGLFAQREIDLEKILLAYHTLFDISLEEFTLTEAITDLEKIGILYGNRSLRGEIDKVIIPKYLYGILPQIKAKLPKVIISDEKKET